MDMGKESLIALADLVKESRTLKSIDLGETVEFKLPECITAWKNALLHDRCQLEEISFAQCALSVDGIKDIASIFSKNSTVKKLDLSRNKLGKPGLLSLVAPLQANTSLQTLSLRAVDISIPIFEEFLTGLDLKNITLKSIEINENGKAPISEWRALSLKANTHFQFFL